MWRSLGLAFVAAWMSLALALVVPEAQRPETPQFRAGVEVVAVDVSVVDRDGRPVPDLKPADFTLTVDGKPRRLASAEFVSLATRGSARAAPASRPGAGEASDGFSTNERVQPGRLIVLAIDQGHLQPTSVPGAVAAATRFLAGLGPADQVALVAFPQGGPSVPFTTRHDRIQEALKRVAGKAVSARSTSRLSISEALSYSRSGGSPMPGEPWAVVLDRECAGTTRTGGTALDKACVDALQAEAVSVAAFEQQITANTLAVLTDIVERLGEIEGPKTLVLLSEGLVVGGDRVGQDSQVGTASQVGQAAYKARVNIYVLQLDRAFLDSFSVEYRTPPLSAGAEGQVMAAGLETLAGAARGAMFRITASADRAFNRVTLETSAFYLLAFEPEPADRDGKPHNIRVRVQRPNVSVRSRAEFVVGGSPRPVRSAEEEVTSLLQSPVLASGLPLRVGTFTLRDAATLKPRVLVAVDIARGVTAPAAVALGYAIVDGTGAPVGSYVKTESLKPFGIGDEACWKHAQAMLLNPGDYTLKFAAVDPQGRRGSVEHRMTVGIQRAGSAQVSDLLLLDPSGEGPGGSNPAISGTITTDAVTMYLEVYSAQAGRPGKATATFEVASKAAGEAMFTRQSAVAVKADEQLWVVAGTVELPLLPPGDYVARVQLTVDGRPVARATRVFHLALRMGAGASPRTRASFRDAGAFVRAFDRDSVLRPDVIRYFVKRMADVGGPLAPPAVVAAIAHAEAKAFDEVLKDLEGADAGQLAVPFLRGLARFAAGDLASAGKEFRGSLLVSSEFLPAAFYLGACYAAGGRDGEAVGAWQTALITESEAPIVYDMLADALLRLRDTARARAIIDEARGKWPGDDLLVPRLAATHALDGRAADALKELSAYLERHADDEQALFLALRVLFDAHAAGGVVRSEAEDRADLARFAKLYEATAGVNKEIVARWVAFVESRKR